jgi:hypothetical protein
MSMVVVLVVVVVMVVVVVVALAVAVQIRQLPTDGLPSLMLVGNLDVGLDMPVCAMFCFFSIYTTAVEL